MPYTTKQRRAAFAELENRSKGQAPKMFKGMSGADLKTYAHEPAETVKKKKPPFPPKSKKPTVVDQADAIETS